MATEALAVVQMSGYVSLWKIICILLLLLVWIRLLTWIDKDAPVAHLPRELLNSCFFAALVAGYFLFFFLPGFGFAFGILALIFVASIGTYVLVRQQRVGLKDLKRDFANWLAGFKGTKKKEVKVGHGEVLIVDKAGNSRPVPDAESPDLLRYQSAQALLTQPLRLGAERIDLAAGSPAGVTYFVDGVRYEGAAMNRDNAGAAVQYLKDVAELDLGERRKPQTSTFKTAIDGQRNTIQVTTFGSAAGESARLLIDPQARHNFTINNLGFTESQIETIKASINEGGGVVLLAAPRGLGLTSLNYGVIRAHDAFLHHVHTLERIPELDLEGITQNSLPANATPGDEAKQVEWICSQEPDVVMVTHLEAPESAVALAKFATDSRRAYAGLRAINGLDALKQWRKLVGDDGLALKNLRMVISGRPIRRLCAACKIGYKPDPGQLRKLNMNPEVVGQLFMGRKEPLRDNKGNPIPCTFCHDLGYKGRFGVYEVLPIDAEVKKLILAGASEAQLKQQFRKQRSRLMQEIALSQVEAGETSVDEVLRVLKAEPAQPAQRSASSEGAPRAGGPVRPRPVSQ